MEGNSDITLGRLVEVTLDTMTPVLHSRAGDAGVITIGGKEWRRTRAGERGLVVAVSEANPNWVQVLIGGEPRDIRRRDLRPLEGVE